MNHEQTAGNDATSGVEVPERRIRRRYIAAAVILLIAISAFVYWLLGRGWESTDDAQIRGDLVPITSKVAGYVDGVLVDDNQAVDIRQVLVQLDRRDFEAKLRSAEANLATLTAQASASAAQLALTQRTAPAGASQAGAQVGAAESGVAAARTQVSAAEAQASAAEATARAAHDAIAAARSEVETEDAQVEAARAAVQSAQANVSSAEAQAEKTASDAVRYRELLSQGATSKQQYESAQAANTSAQSALKSARELVRSANAALARARAEKAAAETAVRQSISRARAADAAASQARAGIKSAQAGLLTARSQLSGAEAGAEGARTVPQQLAIGQAQNRAADARIRQALADVRNARLQLSYTTIAAPVTGVVGQKSVEPGQYVQPGQMLMAVVPLHRVWVVANFKETQISGMKVGQRADIDIDAYPGRKFQGRVESIGPATGAQFSLLPPENATGNFVKVVQRVPVKIVFDRGLPRGVVLRPGMNVTANVNTRGEG